MSPVSDLTEQESSWLRAAEAREEKKALRARGRARSERMKEEGGGEG
jgi:hypothetical protein